MPDIVYIGIQTFHLSGKVNELNSYIWVLQKSRTSVGLEWNCPNLDRFCLLSQQKRCGVFFVETAITVTMSLERLDNC